MLRRRWDDLREKRFARQKETGLFSADTQMAERNAEAFLDVERGTISTMTRSGVRALHGGVRRVH